MSVKQYGPSLGWDRGIGRLGNMWKLTQVLLVIVSFFAMGWILSYMLGPTRPLEDSPRAEFIGPTR